MADKKRTYLQLENNSSIDFVLRQEGANTLVLKRHSSILVRCNVNNTAITIENLWCGADQKVQIDLAPFIGKRVK